MHFGECNQAHDSWSNAVVLHEEVKSVKEVSATIPSADDRKKLSEELKSLMKVNEQQLAICCALL